MIKFLILFSLFSGCSYFSNDRSNLKRDHYYQLQNYNENFVMNISKMTNALWVIDRDFDGSRPFNKFDLMKMKNNDSNIIFSYMSVGEAESYRPYFKSIPKTILAKENPHWPGSFDVNFWDNKWHEILYASSTSYINKIVESGFDGVYLDVVDAYQRHEDKKLRAEQMASLIKGISKKAKSLNSNFKIYLQNGSEIINSLDENSKSSFIAAVDGLSVEGYFFDYSDPKKPVRSDWFKTLEPVYKEYQALDKDILMIEYVENELLQKEAVNYCNENKIHLLITDRLLKGKFFINN